MTTLGLILLTVAALAAVIGFPLAMLDNPERRRKREAPKYVMIVRSPGGHGPSGAGRVGEDPDHTRPESGIVLTVPTTRTDSTR